MHSYIVSQLDVRTGVVTEYSFPEGVYPQEPWFVASPDSVNEDDGVLLLQGLDGRIQKGQSLTRCMRDVHLYMCMFYTQLYIWHKCMHCTLSVPCWKQTIECGYSSYKTQNLFHW